MPSSDKHTIQAEHNDGLLAFLEQQDKQTQYSDWYVTIAFYSALHYFEAMLFAVKPQTSANGSVVEHSSDARDFYGAHSDHHARNSLLRHKFHRLRAPYSTLYRMSRTARYNCHQPNANMRALAGKLLDNVKRECAALVGR